MSLLAPVLAFALWTVMLLLAVVNYRGLLVLSGKRRIESFPAQQAHEGAEWYQRLQRAHMNALETLPVFAVVVFAAFLVGGFDSYASLCWWVFYARVAHTVLHLLTVHPNIIWLRFTAFLAQQLLLLYLGIQVFLKLT